MAAKSEQRAIVGRGDALDNPDIKFMDTTAIIGVRRSGHGALPQAAQALRGPTC